VPLGSAIEGLRRSQGSNESPLTRNRFWNGLNPIPQNMITTAIITNNLIEIGGFKVCLEPTEM
jgi:hypothetical protein